MSAFVLGSQLFLGLLIFQFVVHLSPCAWERIFIFNCRLPCHSFLICFLVISRALCHNYCDIFSFTLFCICHHYLINVLFLFFLFSSFFSIMFMFFYCKGTDVLPAELLEKAEMPKVVFIGFGLAALLCLLLGNAALFAWFIIRKRSKGLTHHDHFMCF